MNKYRITIYANNGVVTLPIYEVVWAAPTIIDAHCAGRNMCSRFDKHAPCGTNFMVFVTDEQ